MQGKTVLMFAIEAKLEALCDKLIEQGADINARDDIYVAPLSRIMQGSATRSILTAWPGGDFWPRIGTSTARKLPCLPFVRSSGLQRLLTLCCLGMGCVWLNRQQNVSLLSLPPCSRTSGT